MGRVEILMPILASAGSWSSSKMDCEGIRIIPSVGINASHSLPDLHQTLTVIKAFCCQQILHRCCE